MNDVSDVMNDVSDVMNDVSDVMNDVSDVNVYLKFFLDNSFLHTYILTSSGSLSYNT